LDTRTRGLLLFVGVALSLPTAVHSGEPAKRPEWNQKKAVEIVKNVIDLENKGEGSTVSVATPRVHHSGRH